MDPGMMDNFHNPRFFGTSKGARTVKFEKNGIKSIGKYQIRSRLGQGSMGQVYKVLLPDENGFAALKILKPHSELIHKMTDS